MVVTDSRYCSSGEVRAAHHVSNTNAEFVWAGLRSSNNRFYCADDTNKPVGTKRIVHPRRAAPRRVSGRVAPAAWIGTFEYGQRVLCARNSDQSRLR
jgi:hypothetical protein